MKTEARNAKTKTGCIALNLTMAVLAPVLLFASFPTLLAFSSSPDLRSCARFATRLRGLPEWRQITGDGEGQTTARNPIFLLPFAAEEALFPGQATSLVLKQGKFLDLFQDSLEERASMVGIVLMGEDGLLDAVPLCEIVDFDADAGFRGRVSVRVTLRAVSRAKLVELIQTTPVMAAWVTEIVDDAEATAGSVRAMLAANKVVDDIERIIADITKTGDDSDVGGFSHQERYQQAFQRTLHTITSNNSNSGGDTQREKKSNAVYSRSLSELQAASWSVFASIASASSSNAATARQRHEALVSTNLVERLKFGKQLLMEEILEKQFLNSGASSSFYQPNEDQSGFGFE